MRSEEVGVRGEELGVGDCNELHLSIEMFFLLACLVLSTAMFRHIVRQNASIDSISSHLSRRFHTFIIVSCTTSSASALFCVIRNASL